MISSLFIALLAALPAPSGVRRYELLVGGRAVGRAELRLEGEAGGLRYGWRAAIAIGGRPCLWAREAREGGVRPREGAPLPEEVALPLALARGLREVDLAGTAGGGGRLVVERVSGREASGTVLGEPFHARIGTDGLPEIFELPRLGVVYRAAASLEGSDALCRAASLRGPLPVAGLPSGIDPRWLRVARFRAVGAGAPLEAGTVRSELPLDPRAAALVRAAAERSAGRDCQAVAKELRDALVQAGFQAKVVGGFLLDREAEVPAPLAVRAPVLWPHAWVELATPRGPVALDSTTGEGLADAGRLALGPLEGERALETGLALLRWRAARVTLVEFR